MDQFYDATTLPGIATPTETAMRAWVARQRAALQAAGHGDGTTQDVAALVHARIDVGRWILDCACGAGVAVLVQAGKAGCPECGRIYTNVRVASNRGVLERELLERRPGSRFWNPGESVADLRDQLAVRPEMKARRR